MDGTGAKKRSLGDRDASEEFEANPRRKRVSRFGASVETSASSTSTSKEETLASMRSSIKERLSALKNKTKKAKVDVEAEEPKKKKEEEEEEEALPPQQQSFFAPRPKRRKKREFRWVKEGLWSRRADNMRAREHLSRLLRLKAGEGEGKGDEASSFLVAPTKLNVPDVEWWDLLLEDVNVDDIVEKETAVTPTHLSLTTTSQSTNTKISSLQQHPSIPKPATQAHKYPQQTQLPTLLTDREKTKLKKQRRREKAKEKQDLLRLGLVATPEARLTEGNFMRVLGDEALVNPTAAFATMKAQVEARAEKAKEHDANQPKLSWEDRKTKEKEKSMIDRQSGLFAVVYRLSSLDHPLHRKNIDLTTSSLSMTGCVLLCPRFVIVVAEGGKKACAKFNALMTRRTIWNLPLNACEDEEKEEEWAKMQERQKTNQCAKVWEGAIARPSFKNFQFEAVNSAGQGKHFLSSHGCESYWNAADSMVVGRKFGEGKKKTENEEMHEEMHEEGASAIPDDIMKDIERAIDGFGGVFGGEGDENEDADME